ncbi:GIY-YIG nuclease family protein [Blastochloris tepida]|uniref:Nuclease n=1 Tax=Blastochloris tepida TaxID=2233851 RepID=A0A348G3R3_9HYPH|nr:nuclease [Blastochloris tepida]
MNASGTAMFFVYMLASKPNGTLYIGVTRNLIRRVHEHRIKAVPGFTAKYDVTRLVHVETFNDPETAITREKQLKGWNRAWKIRLIERENPEWRDLFDELAG